MINPTSPLVRLAMKMDCTQHAECVHGSVRSVKTEEEAGETDDGRSQAYQHGIDHDVAEQERAQQQIALLPHRVNLLRVIRWLATGRVRSSFRALGLYICAAQREASQKNSVPQTGRRAPDSMITCKPIVSSESKPSVRPENIADRAISSTAGRSCWVYSTKFSGCGCGISGSHAES